MAGTSGPTSLGGTPETPNPEGGVSPGDKAATDPKREGAGTAEPSQDKAPRDRNEDG